MGPYVIHCPATGGYLANRRGVVFRKSGARGFSLLKRAEFAFNVEQKREDSMIGPGNPLGWEIIPKSEAVDLSI